MAQETRNESVVREMFRSPYTGNDLVEAVGDLVDPGVDKRFLVPETGGMNL